MKDLTLGTLAIGAVGAGIMWVGGQQALNGYIGSLWTVGCGSALMLTANKVSSGFEKAIEKLSEGIVNGSGVCSQRIWSFFKPLLTVGVITAGLMYTVKLSQDSACIAGTLESSQC